MRSVIAALSSASACRWVPSERRCAPVSAAVVRVRSAFSLPKGLPSGPVTVGPGCEATRSARSRIVVRLNLPDGSTILVAENTRSPSPSDYDAQSRDRTRRYTSSRHVKRRCAGRVGWSHAPSNFSISTPTVGGGRGTVTAGWTTTILRDGRLRAAVPPPGGLPARVNSSLAAACRSSDRAIHPSGRNQPPHVTQHHHSVSAARRAVSRPRNATANSTALTSNTVVLMSFHERMRCST